MFTFQSIIFVVLVISGLIFAYFSTHPMTHSIEATTFLPSLPTIQTIRLDDQRFQSWHDSSSWDLLTPKNGGLVVEIDLTNGKSHRSQISMFHQLQCLRTIREVYLTISQSTSGRHEFRNNTGDDTQYHFLLDCWDYLRQGILCAADSTLQPIDKTGSTGLGLWHSCKDSSILYDWVEKSEKSSLIRK